MNKLGPTGQFPRGRLNTSDEGELTLAITVHKKTVVIAFGKPISWIGFSRIEALELAKLITTRAEEIMP